MTLLALAQAPVRDGARTPAAGSAAITVTDTSGRFELTRVPAGTDTLSAARSGYLAIQDGQRRPREPGRTVEIMPALACRAIALDAVEDGQWDDPSFLEALRDQAARLVLAEGGTSTISLKLPVRKETPQQTLGSVRV